VKNKRENLIGQKCGKLTVIESLPDKKYGKKKYPYWKCVCECGNYTTRISGNIKKRNGIPQCSECKKEKIAKITRKNKGEASFNWLFGTYLRRSKKENIKFCLEKNQFKEIF